MGANRRTSHDDRRERDMAALRVRSTSTRLKKLAERSRTCSNVVAITSCDCESSTRPPIVATGPFTCALPFQSSVVVESPFSLRSRAGKKVDDAPQSAACDLHIYVASARLQASSVMLNLKLPRTGPTATLTVASKLCASFTSTRCRSGRHDAIFGGSLMNAQTVVFCGGDLLLPVPLEVHAAALRLRESHARLFRA